MGTASPSSPMPTRIPPSPYGDKILPFDTAPAHLEAVKAQGRVVVQCHGTFDLIHPGHIQHLAEARELGDVLVVTITADAHVNKGPGRPCFEEQLRARSLAALASVDYVVIVPHPTAIEAITCVKPHIYCKGIEYQNPENDPTGNIRDDVTTVQAFGGEVRYVGSVVFSSTRLLNNHFDHLASPVREFCRALASRCTPDQFRDAVERFAGLRVLVVGEVIFDRYSRVHVQGLTSKNRILSGRFVGEDTHAGGALAVARHVRQFTPFVKLVSTVGTEPWVEEALAVHLGADHDAVIRDRSIRTIAKQRFVEAAGERTLNKLFSVNYIDDAPLPAAVESQVLERLERELPGADAVFVADFGHGLMQEAVRELVQDRAPLLMLNCQTNSNNHGFNVISRQYRRAAAFSLDEQEIMLACGQRHPQFELELQRLRLHFDADYAWLTRGAVETIGAHRSDPSVVIPPFETRITDTIGAGDAFFSVAGLAAARGLPVDLGTFMGQLAGAQAVKIIGNAAPVSKAHLVKSGMSLLNF